MDILYVVLEVLIILGIIALGAFIIVLVADLILSSFDGHKGIFFNRNKKIDEPAPEAKPQPEANPTVTPYYEEIAKNAEEEKPEPTPEPQVQVSSVDFDKAAEEQKLIKRRTVVEEKPAETTFEEDNEEELADAIKEVSLKALQDIASDSESKRKAEEEKRLEEEERRKAEEELRKAEEERRKAEEERRLAEEERRRLEEERQEQLRLEKEELERQLAEERSKTKVKTVVVKDEGKKELKKLRDDIFSLRRSAFKDMQEIKTTTQTTQETEIEVKLRELDELKEHKKSLDKERSELLKYKDEALNKESELARIAEEKAALAEEKAELQRQIKELQQKTAETLSQKPYYTKEYYLKRLDSLQTELKDVEKELKANRREFVPLERIKKSYDRDQEKLRRKEAIVAKQKVAIYGVKASNVDPKRKEKLDEDVKQLNQLKESVFQCDQVLKQNKDRYPVLEKANRLLTKTYNRLVADIENVNAALAWYEENEKGE